MRGLPIGSQFSTPAGLGRAGEFHECHGQTQIRRLLSEKFALDFSG
jgi:hypothetical protein